MSDIPLSELTLSSLQKEGTPSQEEQDIAEDYVRNRKLDRPDITASFVIKHFIMVLLSSALILLIAIKLIDHYRVFALIPEKYGVLYIERPVLFFFLSYIFILFVLSIINIRRIFITAIKLYQHYASEDVRRRCLFKPTCSEYAILAVQKYGMIRGLYKTYDRLFNRCRGNIYHIDYP